MVLIKSFYAIISPSFGGTDILQDSSTPRNLQRGEVWEKNLEAGIESPVVPKVELYLLGRPLLKCSGAEVELKSRKTVAALAVLASEEGAYTRQRLATLLWGSSSQSRANANLRHALHQIRGLVPELLDLDHTSVSLNDGVWTDLAQADRLELHRGPFCDGLELKDCPDFDTWLTGQRTRWREQAVAGWLQRAEDQMRAEHDSEALRSARQALNLDPLSERAHALIIKILRRRGDLAAARRQWDTCLQASLRELGSVPSSLACWGPAVAEGGGCRLYLLGKPRIISQGEDVDLPYQKTTALLAYLAIHGQAVERDEVRKLLWPTVPGTKAAANLRHAVHFLRKSVGDVLCAHGQSLWLDRTRLWLDVDWFEEHPEEFDSVGVFCEGLALPESPHFENWLNQQRARFSEPVRPRATKAPKKKRGNLPAELTPLVGAETQLRQAEGLMVEARLVTITGSAGVGKTRLALELGRATLADWPDGAWVVELGSLFDPDRLWERICSTLEIAQNPGLEPHEQLVAEVADQTVLLLMDNCEHLVSAVAEAISYLLRSCPNLKVIATSRELLRVPGETVLHLEPLATPPPGSSNLEDFPAVELFMTRARSVNPRFQMSAEVGEICRRLDGLPLAIELAAVRTRALSAEQIARGLNNRFRLLRGGPRTVPQRQQTLEAALAWSYDLLSEEERIVFRRLSVFAGSFDLEAAAEVCEMDLFDHLADLIDRSMVQSREGTDGYRYGMLETVRDFAYRKLEALPELDQVRERHFELCLHRAATREVPGVAGLKQLEQDHGNFGLALEWGFQHRPQRALQLAAALGDYWFYRGYFAAGCVYLERALAQGRCPKALLWSGRLHQARGDYARAQAEFEESAQLATEPLDQARALNARTQAGFSQGDYLGSREFALRALELWTSQGNQRGQVDTLHILATAEICLGEADQAREQLRESLELSRQLGYQWGESSALYLQGLNSLFQGELREAEEHLTQSLELCRSIGNAPRTAACLGNLGLAATAEGDFERAEAYFAEAESSGYQGVEAFLLYGRGVLELKRGAAAKAAQYLRQSLGILRSMHVRESVELVLLCYARALGEGELSRKLADSAIAFKKSNASVMPAYLAWGPLGKVGRALSLEEALDLALK